MCDVAEVRPERRRMSAAPHNHQLRGLRRLHELDSSGSHDSLFDDRDIPVAPAQGSDQLGQGMRNVAADHLVDPRIGHDGVCGRTGQGPTVHDANRRAPTRCLLKGEGEHGCVRVPEVGADEDLAGALSGRPSSSRGGRTTGPYEYDGLVGTADNGQ